MSIASMIDATAQGFGVAGVQTDMLITIRNWMSLVTDALEILPADLRSTLEVRTDVVGSLSCLVCGGTWFRLNPEASHCYACVDGGFVRRMIVELGTVRPRIAVCRGERILASAVLLRLPKSIELSIPEAEGEPFRVRSQKPENSPEAFQRRFRSVLFPELGLASDGEGAWGWRGGERLDGGRMVPTLDELLEELERQDRP